VALLLTARRQRYTELTLVHTTRDATERRITELYTKAADQLGSDKAPVRLAGLYALERLAHSTVEHRQTIVDVICAYLRMPYTPPKEQPEDDSPEAQTRYENHRQEQQVRLIAQNILYRNLLIVSELLRRRWYHTRSSSGPPSVRAVPPNWSNIRLALTGALLHNFSLGRCQLNHVDLTKARFTGEANFERAQFSEQAKIEGVEFQGAQFQGVQFQGKANFKGAQFTGWTCFEGVQFQGEADFEGAQFTHGVANFRSVQFTGKASFDGARVTSTDESGSVWPPGWTTRPARPDNGEDPAFLYLARVEDGNPLDT
jgi:uncharacterized protein YjbI with pentapeptide repeats